MPGIGTMKVLTYPREFIISGQGVATQCNDTILVCMKIMGKTINAKEKISGDFMVQVTQTCPVIIKGHIIVAATNIQACTSAKELANKLA